MWWCSPWPKTLATRERRRSGTGLPAGAWSRSNKSSRTRDRTKRGHGPQRTARHLSESRPRLLIAQPHSQASHSSYRSRRSLAARFNTAHISHRCVASSLCAATAASGLAHRCALPREHRTVGDGICEPFAAAKRDALKWLRKNAPPPADLAKRGDALRHARRRGRPRRRRGGRGGERDADGENEMAVGLGRAAIFSEHYALPYACANEPRTHWHGLLAKAVEPILDALPRHGINPTSPRRLMRESGKMSGKMSAASSFTVARLLLIFDPGVDGCVRLRVVHGRFYHVYRALRVAGVPARLVGTPTWLGDPLRGNHNWVELWDGAVVAILGRPTRGRRDAGESAQTKWFCKAAGFPINGSTRVYAARFDRRANQSIYP